VTRPDLDDYNTLSTPGQTRHIN